MSIGKIFILTGAIILMIGLLISFGNRIPFLVKLPGGLVIEKGNTKIFIPITTSILLSIVLSIVVFLINKLRS